MQTQRRQFKMQCRVFATTAVIALLCAIFILSIGASIPRNIENNNTFYENTQVFVQNPNFDKLRACAQNGNEYVKIGGKPIGISIKTEGLIVDGKGSVQTNGGEVVPLKNLKITKGDVLLSLNEHKVNSLFKLKELLANLENPNVEIEYIHQGIDCKDKAVLAKDKTDGKYKLGLSLKEDVGGVGTLTFVTKQGNFAALGHKISDGDGNLDMQLDEGNIYNASVSGIVKGERGKAGGLVADVNRLSKSVGEIAGNTNIGLFGEYTAKFEGDLYRIAQKGEARIGKAQVLTTIDGATPKFYDVEIVKVISQSEPAEKGMVVKVCDKDLIAKTGGIVQGMSGSPIVQDGILIGAITHVFVQDPLRGYAVHSRFMFDKANDVGCDSDLQHRLVA